jgi:transposase-like protein
MKPTNVRQFFQQFPTDEACLEHLFNVRFGQGHTCPKCEREAKWYPIKAEKAFSCQWCGHHIHPMVDTIFEKSRTPLQLWFYAVFLFTTSRHGVSGKELQRQLGVTYKTAYRMGTLIRKHMAAIDGDAPLGGRGKVVEVDETYVGGKGTGKDKKTIVLGIMERDGKVMTKVVPDASRKSLTLNVARNVKRHTEIHADMAGGYDGLHQKWPMKRVNKDDWYVGPDGEHVNSIENFWRHLKCSIKGTHISVSPEYLERYAKEFEYRFNRRMTPETMLSELLYHFPELGA